jgi:MFS family permease
MTSSPFLAALRHRNFRLFCFGQIISLCGTWMQSVAQTWLVYRLTHSEFLMGLTQFCLQIPVFALAPLGGLVSDRRPRRRIVVLCQSLLMAQALALGLLTVTGRIAVPEILTLAVVMGCINAFDMPARQSFIVEMTGKEDLLNAISLNSSIFNAARVAGPALAGLLVHKVGEGPCFLLNAASFVPVVLSLLAMQLPPYQKLAVEEPWEHLMQGFRYAYQTVHIRYLLLLLAAATMSGATALVLMPFFADAILGRGSQGLGALLASMGVGALAGTLILAGRGTTQGLIRVVLLGSAGLGVSLILLGVSRNYQLSLLIMLALGFSTLRQLAATNTLIQSLIPDEYRGRIMSMYTMNVVGLVPFGSIATGAAAERFGAPATVAAGGFVCLAATLLFWVRRDRFQRSAEGTLH